MKSFLQAMLQTGVMLLAVSLAATPAPAQQVTQKTVDGVTNFKQLGTTIACAGAVKATAVADIKKLGFASIINLRRENEPGADIEAEAAAAQKAGIRFYWIPFDASLPDSTVADRFLSALATPGSEPAFIHCHSGNRAAAMWMIKRMVVDHWDTERAAAEATALGLTSPTLKQFAIDYARAHKR